MKKFIQSIIVTLAVALTFSATANATLTQYIEENGNSCTHYVEQWNTETPQFDLTDRIDFMASHTEDHHSDLISVTAQIAFIPDHDLVNATIQLRVHMYGMSELGAYYDIDSVHTVTKPNINAQAGQMVVFTIGRGDLMNLPDYGEPEPGTGNHIHNLTFWTEFLTELPGQDQVIQIKINETTSWFNIGDCEQD